MRQAKLWLITIVALLCSLTASAHDFVVDGIYYNITSSTNLTVGVTYGGSSYSEYSNEYSGTVIIPSTVTHNSNTYNVTSIGNYTFRDCSSLTSITIPESVTSIENYAFDNCSTLKEVIFENGDKTLSLGYNQFNGINNLGQGLFDDCPLKSVYLGRNLNYRSDNYSGYSPFYYKTQLTTLTISDNVTSIGSFAFNGCMGLESIIIPESVMNIGSSAFESCHKLYKVVNYSNLSLSVGSSSYGYIAYYAKHVIKGSELTTIGDFQFSTSNGVHYLENYIGQEQNIVLPNDYNGANYQIGTCAFYGYNNLYSVTIVSRVLSIGSCAFSIVPKKTIWLTNTPPTGYANANGSINYVANNQYTSLSNVQIYPYLSSMFEVDGVKYVPVSPSERTCHAIDCAYDSTVEIINVGETTSFKGVAMKVTEVMPYTFYGNNHIKEVAMSHLGNIGNYAFYNCDSIKTVNVSNQGNIGSQAFCNCDAIESATISNQGDIGEQAFYDCDGIKTIEVNNRGSIGTRAFYGCNGMETAIIDNVGKVNSEAFSSCSSLHTVTLGDSIGSLGNKAFYQCTSLQEFVVPNSVKAVGEYCLSGCSAMKSATIGDGVSNIAAYTFQGCTALEDVVVGDGVTTISNYTFTGCSELTNIELGNSVATINNYAFQNCSSLPEISIPQATTSIGNYAFYGCSKLADVIIEDRTTALSLGSNGSSSLFADCPLDSVYIGGKITYNTASDKGYSPFYRNTSLRSVVITDREEQVYDNEFYGCTNLQNVTIGNGVKSIGNYAFSGCSSLAGFSFGSSIEHRCRGIL